MPIIKPHRKTSRPVTPDDYELVKQDAKEMQELCHKTHGTYAQSGYAVAHPQISEDPLRFFVMHDGKIIMNPVILRQTRHPVDKMEGCLSYPEQPHIQVPRSHKCEVTYQTFNDADEVETKTENLSSLIAQIFQHEIDHFEGKYIVDSLPS